MPVISKLRRLRKEDFCKFEVSLGCRVKDTVLTSYDRTFERNVLVKRKKNTHSACFYGTCVFGIAVGDPVIENS